MQAKRVLVWSVPAVLVIALVIWLLIPRPVPVEVGAAVRGAFEQTIDEDGKTRVRERYVVSAPLAGTLSRLSLKVGDRVERGAILATLAPVTPAMTDPRTRIELEERAGAGDAARLRAQANVERARAALQQSEADLARTRTLAAQGFVAAAAREQAELLVQVNRRGLEAATFELHAAEHEAAQAHAALLRTQQFAARNPPSAALWEIRAPVAADVLKVNQESETVVALGAPIVEIGDRASLEVVVDVLSTDAVQIRPGSRVRLEVGQGLPVFIGRVRRIEPAAFTKVSALGVEEQRVNVIIDFVTEPTGMNAVGDGYRVDAHIVVHEREAALKVPVSSLFRDGERWAVFVLDQGRARQQSVEVSRRNGTVAIVESGLTPGQQVILYPGDTLRDGMRVSVTNGG